MYRWIVARVSRSLWRRVNDGDYEAAVRMAHPDVRFRFVGDTPLGADLVGVDAFRAWFREATERIPGLTFEVRDVLVAGWPWDTRIAVRLGVTAPLADGTTYRNEAAQFLRLKWFRMVDDWVIEDTVALRELFERQRSLQAADGG
jgi:ketosteroid isomerase-like protein